MIEVSRSRNSWNRSVKWRHSLLVIHSFSSQQVKSLVYCFICQNDLPLTSPLTSLMLPWHYRTTNKKQSHQNTSSFMLFNLLVSCKKVISHESHNVISDEMIIEPLLVREKRALGVPGQISRKGTTKIDVDVESVFGTEHLWKLSWSRGGFFIIIISQKSLQLINSYCFRVSKQTSTWIPQSPLFLRWWLDYQRSLVRNQLPPSPWLFLPQSLSLLFIFGFHKLHRQILFPSQNQVKMIWHELWLAVHTNQFIIEFWSSLLWCGCLVTWRISSLFL